MAAFRAAIDYKVSAIEFDLLHTKDQKTIIFHDKKLGRVVRGKQCPKGEKIEDLTLNKIRSKCYLSNGEKIPTLEDGLRVLSGQNIKLFIEFKDYVLNKDFEMIEEYLSNRPEDVFIISFDKKVLRAKEQQKTPFYSKVRTVKLQKYAFYSSFKDVDVVDAKYISKRKVKRLQRTGKMVGVYTKNKSKKILKYLNKGVDFITTDEPLLCEEIIDNHAYPNKDLVAL